MAYEVRVKSLAGAELVVECTGADTVSTLSGKVQGRCAFLFRGRVLQKDTTLSSLNIQPSEFIVSPAWASSREQIAGVCSGQAAPTPAPAAAA